MALERGQKSIGLFTQEGEVTTLPPSLESRSVAEQIEYIKEKLLDVDVILERKADGDKLKTLIAVSDEAIQIQAEDIVLIGDITIASIVKEQNGTTSGQLPASITRIVGDRIQTGTIFSNNYSTTEGSAYDLDNGTITIGGSDSPALFFDGTDLTVSGQITANSFVIGRGTLGDIADNANDAISSGNFDTLLQSELDAGVANIIAGTGADYRLYVNTTAGSIVAKHKDANENGLGGGYFGTLRTGLILSANGLGMGYNRKSDGNWVNAIAIESDGDVNISGTLTADSIISDNATVGGTSLGDIRDQAADAIASANFPSLLQTELDSGVADIIAGTGNDYVLEVTSSSVVAKHKDANIAGGASYSGTIRTGVIISSAGIGMGYNDTSSGNWVNAIAIESNGDVSLLGTLTAGSIVSGSATVDGVDFSTIRNNASAGASIQEKLEVTGNTVLRGVVQPTNTGGIRTGNISWNTTTGALVSGSGVAITEYGIIGASSGSATFIIEADTGNATFSGDLVTSGQVKSTGETVLVTDLGSRTGAMVSEATASGVYGIVATSQLSNAGYFYSASSDAIFAIVTDANDYAIQAVNSEGGGGAISAGGDILVTSNGNINVTNGSVVIGAQVDPPTISEPALYLKERNAPTAVDDQIAIHGALVESGTVDEASSLGLVTERPVETGTGNFTGFNQLRIRVNGTEYNLPLEVA